MAVFAGPKSRPSAWSAKASSTPMRTLAAELPNFGRALFGSFEGLTPAVWLVVALKSLNGILIPATLKYAGNLVYLYAKPTSIVMTALASAVYSSTVPPASFCAGAALVIWSMANFKK